MSSSLAEKRSSVAVVAIGRNEGERLRACLASVSGEAAVVVYVDSGSTDGSVELAAELGADVVKLDMSRPFAAGRARNEGFRRARELCPELEYVQFVDGDCELAAGWLRTAIAELERSPDVAVVCGRRRERFPERSVYNALCDIEWDTPVGEATACGGDSLMRAAAFAQVGGFDDAIVAGEEPELCIRLRRSGFRILRLPEEMTLHDAAMHRFSQWWKRTLRSGHAHAELAHRYGNEPDRPGVRSTLSNVWWAAVFPAGIVAGLRVTPASALGVAIYPVMVARICRKQLALGRTPEQALAYAASCTLGKFPEAVGAARYYFGALTGNRSRIIEYKGPDA